MDFSTLFLEVMIQVHSTNGPILGVPKTPMANDNLKNTSNPKSFASVVSNSVCDIPLSQLPVPDIKGNRLAITIPEEEYKLGLEAC